MMAFARVVLVCFLVSPCLLKHTLSLPLVLPEEDEAFNEIDFEEEIPEKDYDNVDEDPDFNPEDYEEYYEEYELAEDDDVDNEGKEDKEDEGKEVEEEVEEEEEEEEDDDEGEEEKTLDRKKRDLDGVYNIDEELDPEEEELRAMELEEDQIPVDKDVVENPPEYDDKSEDFDEEEDIFKDALGPDDEDDVQGNEDDDELDRKKDLPSGGGELHLDDEDDDVDEMDSEEKDYDESRKRTDFPSEDHAIEQSVDEEDDAGFFGKFKDFMRSIAGFLYLGDQNKNKET